MSFIKVTLGNYQMEIRIEAIIGISPNTSDSNLNFKKSIFDTKVYKSRLLIAGITNACWFVKETPEQIKMLITEAEKPVLSQNFIDKLKQQLEEAQKLFLEFRKT